jgi:hypothetical protein
MVTAMVAALLLQAGQAAASHLSEAEVMEMERRCDQLRQQKLAPEKAAVLKQCLDAGELDRAACQQKAAEYGEQQTAPLRRPGKYYDLPECQEAYQARKHYDLNPGR